ncbi:DUF6868 family protein [Lysobacter koreensis]|uniref:DUF6868 family protein n=1 Tax=Lysobacter koreensis TaxID=266122 RepID=A0ABW2YM16_9GAMM
MDSTLWPAFVMWCAVFNYAALTLAFVGFVLAHDWLYRLHRRWFELPVAKFDAIAYFLLGLYKLAIWFFLIVPALVLCYLPYAPRL